MPEAEVARQVVAGQLAGFVAEIRKERQRTERGPVLPDGRIDLDEFRTSQHCVEMLSRVHYQHALRLIAEGRAGRTPAAFARRILQQACEKCNGDPPGGFSCNACGASG